MLTICTFLWGNKYGDLDVAKLYAGVKRNLQQPFRFMCLTEREREFSLSGIERHAIKDPELLEHRGCFARLRLFDPGWQRNRGIDDRLACMDLDTVVTGPLDPVFDRQEPFVVLQGANKVNPCPFNGSLWMLRPGAHPELWLDFSLEAAAEIPFHEFPDDQGWFHYKVPDAAGWQAGKGGVYAFQKPGWPSITTLPKDARIVVFPGKRSPAMYNHLGWVREHWRC